ncbi:MAG: J domain-containing protein [Myxococcota bacterium]
MAHLGQRTFASWGKRLAELTDAELAEEARRRRATRSGRSPERSPPPRPASAARPDAKQVRRWYANLEVPEGTDLDGVERAYERLMRRYDPDRHRHDPERHRAAVELVRSLTRAYRGLSRHLRSTE